MIERGISVHNALEEIAAPKNPVIAKVGETFLLGSMNSGKNGPLILEGKYSIDFIEATSWYTFVSKYDTILIQIVKHLAERSWYPPISDITPADFWRYYLKSEYTDHIDDYFTDYYLDRMKDYTRDIAHSFPKLKQIIFELMECFQKELFFAAATLALIAADSLFQEQYSKAIFHKREKLREKCMPDCDPLFWNTIFQVLFEKGDRNEATIFTSSSSTQALIEQGKIQRHQLLHGIRTSCDLNAALKAFSFLWFCFELTQFSTRGNEQR